MIYSNNIYPPRPQKCAGETSTLGLASDTYQFQIVSAFFRFHRKDLHVVGHTRLLYEVFTH